MYFRMQCTNSNEADLEMRHIFKGNIPYSLKRKAFEVYVLPVLTYGAETLTQISDNSGEISTNTNSNDEDYEKAPAKECGMEIGRG